MRLGIMQPYFFPYLGHFSLITLVDKWIVFDVTQYTPKTWMNRNRILHPKAGWQYVSVPLSNSSISIKTSEARVLALAETKKSIIGKLTHYKKNAPYFYEATKIVEQAFDSSKDDSLVSLNVCALKNVCEYLRIPFLYRRASEIAVHYPVTLGAGDWAPHICEMLGATEYVNPIGGKEIFDISVFQRHGISLYFSEFYGFEYATDPYSYEPNLSVIDVIMWNSPDVILSALKERTRMSMAV